MTASAGSPGDEPIQPTFSSKFAADLIEFAAERGADRQALVDMTGLPRTAMDREDVRIPCTTVAKLWAQAMAQTGDEHIGLRLGISTFFSANRTTSLIMEASSTVLEAFRLAVDYSVLIADVMAVELGESDQTVYLEFEPKPIWSEQPEVVQLDCLGLTYVAAVSSLRRMIGTEQPPSLLTVALPPPADPNVWHDVFGDVDFSASHHRIGFPAQLKSAAVATRNPGLKVALRNYADETAAAFAQDPPIVREVIAVIVENMTPRPPAMGEVASALGVSGRTLQRALKAEGRTFRGLVENARMELSAHHLRAGELSVDRVARLAGYADTTSFVRAFKRHTGQPPRRFGSGER